MYTKSSFMSTGWLDCCHFIKRGISWRLRPRPQRGRLFGMCKWKGKGRKIRKVKDVNLPNRSESAAQLHLYRSRDADNFIESPTHTPAIICYVNNLSVKTAVGSMHKSFKQVYRTSTLRNINMLVEKPCPREVRYVPGNLSQKPPAPTNSVDFRLRIRKDGKFG